MTGFISDSHEFLDDPFESVFDVNQINMDEDWDADWGWENDASQGDIDSLFETKNEQGSDMDIDIEGPCKADLLGRPECNYGTDKGVCLWMNAVDAGRWASRFGTSEWFRPISIECKSHLIEFLTNASSNPFEYFKDLRTECEKDLETFCSNTSQEQTALAAGRERGVPRGD